MKYISYRNVTFASVTGGSYEFRKGVPTYAPPRMHDELIAMGIVPEEGQEVEKDPVAGPTEPTSPTEREAALFAAFEKIVARGRREDFTAVGAPHAAVLSRDLGWGSIVAKERDAVWSKWTLLQLEKEDA